MDQATESESPTTPDPDYEYLRMQCTVTNNSNTPMALTQTQLQWGKWVQAPTNVAPNGGTMVFTACGREASPSGTEGNVSWTISVPDGAIVVSMAFDVPYVGDNAQSFQILPTTGYTCTASITGTQGSIDYVGFAVFNIEPVPPSDVSG